MSLFARLYFYACADYWHMACDHQNCGSIYSQQKKQHANNENQKSTYKTSECGKETSQVAEGLHSSSVHRGIIPYLLRKNAPVIFPTHAAANDLSVPPREAASRRTHRNLAELLTERHNIQRTPSRQL